MQNTLKRTWGVSTDSKHLHVRKNLETALWGIRKGILCCLEWVGEGRRERCEKRTSRRPVKKPFLPLPPGESQESTPNGGAQRGLENLIQILVCLFHHVKGDPYSMCHPNLLSFSAKLSLYKIQSLHNSASSQLNLYPAQILLKSTSMKLTLYPNQSLLNQILLCSVKTLLNSILESAQTQPNSNSTQVN